MRYCHHCHKLTRGEPVFCNFCGRSYGVKLCSRLHPNPRHAEICSECGSRELTLPQPRVPILLKPLIWAFERTPTLIVSVVIASIVALLLQGLATDQVLRQGLVGLALSALVLLAIWTMLPPLVQRILRGTFRVLGQLFGLLFPRKEQGRRK